MDFRSPAFIGDGDDSLSLSMSAVYSSRFDDKAWNVDVIFHGLVDAYTRGESGKQVDRGSQSRIQRRIDDESRDMPKLCFNNSKWANMRKYGAGRERKFRGHSPSITQYRFLWIS